MLLLNVLFGLLTSKSGHGLNRDHLAVVLYFH